MNLSKLREAEEKFFIRYPGGFNNPELIEIGKKHKMNKMIQLAMESFSKENFNDPELIIESMIKIISRSSLVSVFEKPKFRDLVKLLKGDDKEFLAKGLEKLLYGHEQEGFEMILAILKSGKLAKWPLMTICQTYFRPQVEVFVKPTTVKGIIEFLELDTLTYKPAPTWAFYEEYRRIINEIKQQVDPSLSPYNAAFSGFLMMTTVES